MATPAIILEGLQPTFACTRAGARKALHDPSQTVAANTLDVNTVGGIKYNGVANGGSNLVSTVLTDWNLSANMPVTDLGDFTYEIAFNNVAASVTTYSLPFLSVDRAAECEIRLVAGSVSGTGATTYFSFRSSNTQVGSSFDLSTLSLGADWVRASSVVQAGTSSDSVTFRANVGSAWTIQVRFMRANNGHVVLPGFPDGSIAGASYGIDICDATYTPNAIVETACVIKPYRWSGDSAPTTLPRLFEMQDVTHNVYRANSTAWVYQTPGDNLVLVSDVVADDASVLFHQYDGTDKRISDDDGNVATSAFATNPTGTLRLGNAAAGNRPFHGEIAWLQYQRELTPEERETISAWALTGVGGNDADQTLAHQLSYPAARGLSHSTAGLG